MLLLKLDYVRHLQAVSEGYDKPRLISKRARLI